MKFMSSKSGVRGKMCLLLGSPELETGIWGHFHRALPASSSDAT